MGGISLVAGGRMETKAGSTSNKTRRLALRFVGEVQGVGFRWTTRRLANKLDLTGWVKNEWDGSVSMELQGTDEQIATFFGRLPHAWGRYMPRYVLDERDEIPTRDDEGVFSVRF